MSDWSSDVCSSDQLPDPILGVERQSGCGAVGLPVARTTQFALQAAGDGDRLRLRRLGVERAVEADGQFVAGVVVEEGDIAAAVAVVRYAERDIRAVLRTDRKSTRLNSSH